MYELPNECPETLEHAKLHLQQILDEETEKDQIQDPGQVLHNTSIAFQIISNMEKRTNDLYAVPQMCPGTLNEVLLLLSDTISKVKSSSIPDIEEGIGIAVQIVSDIHKRNLEARIDELTRATTAAKHILSLINDVSEPDDVDSLVKQTYDRLNEVLEKE